MADELAAFFVHYAERYMAGDAPAVADMCRVPFLAVRNGAPIHLADRESLLDPFAG